MISIALLTTMYLVLAPAKWISHLMQLTYISWDFKFLIICLGFLYFTLAWIGENYIFQRLARFIGHATKAMTKQSKKRKEYKLIQERMLF